MSILRQSKAYSIQLCSEAIDIEHMFIANNMNIIRSGSMVI